MKKLFLILPLLLLSCERRVPMYDTSNAVDSVAVLPVDTVSMPMNTYGFAVFVTEEPITVSDSLTVRKSKRYTTEIQTYEGVLSEEDKYRELDLAEKNLRDAELNDVEKRFPVDAQVFILKRDIYTFDTYKDASLKRQEILTTKE